MKHASLVNQMRVQNPGLTTVDAIKAIDMVIAALRTEVEDIGDVRIRGFGIFKKKLRKERTVRNPRTGETSIMREHFVVTFKEARGK